MRSDEVKAPYTFVSIAAPQVPPAQVERKPKPVKLRPDSAVRPDRTNLIKSLDSLAKFAHECAQAGESPIDAYARSLAQNFMMLKHYYKVSAWEMYQLAHAAWRRVHPVGLKLGRPATLQSLTGRVRSQITKRAKASLTESEMDEVRAAFK
jgi:hypothetical protein